MGIPIYFFMILIIIIILIATVVVYFQVYKWHINKALKATTGKRTSMASPYKVAIVMTAMFLLIGILISYYAGYVNAYKDYEEDIWAMSAADIQTFYAEVKEVDQHSILVKGISINDKNYRSEFRYEIWGEVNLEWEDTPITLADLDKGDLVSIVLLTDRFGNTNVFKIQLLADEK